MVVNLNKPINEPIETPVKLNAFQQEVKLPFWAFLFMYIGAVTAGYGGGIRAGVMGESTHWPAYAGSGLALILAPAAISWVGKTLWPVKKVDA